MLRDLARRPILQFAVTGLLAVVVLGALGVALLQRQANTEAIRDARALTGVLAVSVVEPALSTGVLDGDPVALRRFDRVVRERILVAPVLRVKLWTPGGRIVYSDARGLIGKHFALGDEERGAVAGTAVAADVSDLTKPENRYERGHGRVLEVYRGVQAKDGRRLLFETYEANASVAARAGGVWRAFVPGLLGVLILLWLVQLPLAASLARRLRRGQRQREALLREAVAAQEHERRRIAADLHDGPVQELAGVSFALSAAREHLAAGRTHDTDAVLAEAGEQVRGGIRRLRALFVDLYPPALRDEGLPAALADLLAPLQAADVQTTLSTEAGLHLPRDTELILYRGAQEALRNALRHAEPSRVRVEVLARDGHAVLEVADDGHGFVPTTSPTGHLGLRLLDDLARDNGGTLEIDSAPGRGTHIRLEVPTP